MSSTTPFLKGAGSPDFSSDSNGWRPVRRASGNPTSPKASGAIPLSRGGAVPVIRMPFEGSDSSDVAETDITNMAETGQQRRHNRSGSGNSSLKPINEEVTHDAGMSKYGM